MKAGETYTPPESSGSEHVGHTITVLEVRTNPRSDGPDPDDGGPDTVRVSCSCGSSWSFEDRYADDGSDR